MKNIKYTVTHPIFVFMKKHFCPHCKAALTVETAHHLVNSRSEEANPYFSCPNCHAEFSVEELWKKEKGKRASR